MEEQVTEVEQDLQYFHFSDHNNDLLVLKTMERTTTTTTTIFIN